MSGDEGALRFCLLDAARGERPRNDIWEKSQGSDAYFSGAGSQNIWLMRFATLTLRGRETPWREVYDYQLGRAYGGSEFFSLIYWPWHLTSHLALMRSSSPVADLAVRWCALNWALCRELQGSDGSLLFFGQRSAGHKPIPGEMDWLFALASDGLVRRAESWCKAAGLGLKKSWTYEIGMELRPEMRRSWEASQQISAADLESLPLRVPSEIIRTTEGIALVHSRSCNSNTPPILAGTMGAGGRRTVLPEGGGRRIRQKPDDARARIEGGEIVYASSLYTGGEEQRIPLPGGEVLRHLRLGEHTTDQPATEPPLDDSPADLRRIADLLEGLKLPRREQGRQAAIVLALRKGDDPSIYLPVIKAWFRPDSAQAQAAQWREAVQLIEEAR